MQECINSGGYPKVKITYSNGRMLNKFVSVLVANAFPEICGKPLQADWQVHHKDLDKRRNEATNLIYLSLDEHWKIHNNIINTTNERK